VKKKGSKKNKNPTTFDEKIQRYTMKNQAYVELRGVGTLTPHDEVQQEVHHVGKTAKKRSRHGKWPHRDENPRRNYIRMGISVEKKPPNHPGEKHESIHNSRQRPTSKG